MLDRGRAQAGAYLAQNVLPGIAIVAGHPDLDQFMGVEAAIDLRKHCGRQAAVADEYDRLERMGTGPERAALAGIQLNGQGFLLERKL